jgi:hypothetical protein
MKITSLSTTATRGTGYTITILLLGQAPFIARAMQFGLITIKTVSLRMPEFGLKQLQP